MTWTYPNYLAGPRPVQTELNSKMRSILVDWLVDVHLKFRLAEATLYLTVQIIDAYLAKRPTSRYSLQLVGITALLLASKYEDVEAPEISDCTYVCHETYEPSQVLAMELDILRTIDWNLTLPNAHIWLVRIMAIVDATAVARHSAEYYAQRLLLEMDVFDFKPSLVAATAAWLAFGRQNETDCGNSRWPPELVALTGYDEAELAVCGDVLEYYVRQDALLCAKDAAVAADGDYDSVPPLLAVVNKFSSDRFSSVAARPCTAVTPHPSSMYRCGRPAKRPRPLYIFTSPDDATDKRDTGVLSKFW